MFTNNEKHWLYIILSLSDYINPQLFPQITLDVHTTQYPLNYVPISQTNAPIN